MKKVRKDDKKETKRISKISIALLLVLIMVFVIGSPLKNWYEDQAENFISQKTLKALERELDIKKNNTNSFKESVTYLLTMPASLLVKNYGSKDYNDVYDFNKDIVNENFNIAGSIDSASSSSSSTSSNYSSTNVQVENVDEADIIKTDGKYIYSISNNNVVISNAYPANELEKVSTVEMPNSAVPVDIILKENKMVVVGNKYNKRSNTEVAVFDINDKTNVKKIMSYSIDEEYFTSRAIDNDIYILTTSQVEENNILPIYYVDGRKLEMDVKKFKYLKNSNKNKRTTVTNIDLNAVEVKDVSAYAINAKDMYMSENYMYIVSTSNKRNKKADISKIYGLKGIFGITEAVIDEKYETTSSIYKFSLTNAGINVVAKGEVEGKTLNQFSMDEYRGNLRLSLTRSGNNALVIFDKNMDIVGELNGLAEGEKIYSTRFIKDRAYIVTYKTIDPLFVIDLEDPTKPEVLGELKIPGYSSYLHPYDEDTIIGIGMDTREIVYKDDYGKVISTSARLKGLKLALFDVSDVKNPKEKSSITIGDSYTYSPILKNHKALLFSKEKGILAIPVSGLKKEIDSPLGMAAISSVENIYNGYSRYIKDRGLLVFNINKEKVSQKGIIVDNSDMYPSYSRYNSVRGLYLDDVIYAVSNNKIQAVELDNLNPIKDIEL